MEQINEAEDELEDKIRDKETISRHLRMLLPASKKQ